MQTNTNHIDDALVYLAMRLEENKRTVIQDFIEGGCIPGGKGGLNTDQGKGVRGYFLGKFYLHLNEIFTT